MNIKLPLFYLVFFGSILLQGQALQQAPCGTSAPPQQWDSWFNAKVDEYQKNLLANKTQSVSRTIPVIVHVVHYNQAVGTYPNIDSNQVKSQIAVLNDDFAGVGSGVNGVPPQFSNLVANTGIRFCLATLSPSGGVLPERGIDRVNALANTWMDPSTPTVNLQNYINTTIIPATIWDPTKYLNIWLTDKPASVTINGFATYPAGTGLTGLLNGNFGTATNDGIWCYTKAFGTVGSILAPNDKGRTATHELGHWLGLRHIWGDGNCLSDYCHDTPPSKQAYTGCVISTPTNACGINQSPQGEMPMNFMDNLDDACKYMFTPGQNIRMQVALSQCQNRYLLGTHSLCTATPVPASSSSAVASFNLSNSQCLGAPFTPFNTSSGYPNPTFIWSSSPAALFNPGNSVANPAITINNAGSYTLTLVATNSLSSSSYSMVVNATGTCVPFNLCLDSIKMIRNVDTLKSYQVPNDGNVLACQSGFRGYLAGTNCYKDKAFAQYFPTTSFTSTPQPQINSVIVLFNKFGTISQNAFSQVTCRIYGGNNATGPVAQIGSPISYSLNQIVATPVVNTVGYLGKPNYTINPGVIPFRFDFLQPIIPNSNSGFFASVEPNFNAIFADSINIFTNNLNNNSTDSSSWFLQSPSNTWRSYRSNRGTKVQLAIIPQITCSPVLGVKDEKNNLNSNVNIMPNPSNGIISLIFTLSSEENINMSLYNSLGQKLYADTFKQVGSSVLDIDLSSHPNGVYFMELTNGKEKVVKKLIINH